MIILGVQAEWISEVVTDVLRVQAEWISEVVTDVLTTFVRKSGSPDLDWSTV